MDEQLCLSAPTEQVMEDQPLTKAGSKQYFEAFEPLAKVTHAEIKEQIDLVEAVTAKLGQELEMPNKYKIVDRETGEDIFLAVEQTDCFTRQMKQCCPDCAPWNVDLYEGDGKSGVEAFKLEKAWTATCCCFNRPLMTVQSASGDPIGSVIDPFTCCNLVFHAKDHKEKDLVTIDGGCCQLGLFCPCPCGPCSRVTFDIQNPDGQKIGHIVKKIKCCTWFIQEDVDNYDIAFGEVNEVTKLMVLAVSIFMDFKYFNESSRDSNQESWLPEQ